MHICIKYLIDSLAMSIRRPSMPPTNALIECFWLSSLLFVFVSNGIDAITLLSLLAGNSYRISWYPFIVDGFGCDVVMWEVLMLRTIKKMPRPAHRKLSWMEWTLFRFWKLGKSTLNIFTSVLVAFDNQCWISSKSSPSLLSSLSLSHAYHESWCSYPKGFWILKIRWLVCMSVKNAVHLLHSGIVW